MYITYRRIDNLNVLIACMQTPVFRAAFAELALERKSPFDLVLPR